MLVVTKERSNPHIKKRGEEFRYLSNSLPPNPKITSGIAIAPPNSNAKEIRSDLVSPSLLVSFVSSTTTASIVKNLVLSKILHVF